MSKQLVRVEAQGIPPFSAEVEVDGDLDPANMPLRLEGVFTRLPSANWVEIEIVGQLLFANSAASSRTIWFHGTGAGYRFTMGPEEGLKFTAEKL